jgi:capsular polysaccharide export protein
LLAVRKREPQAYVVFKPHPDVLTGNRRGTTPDAATGLYDELVEHAPVDECLKVVDEVHTMTSLVGFEALLRELPVVTYGQPFYAGWGLTEDAVPPPRRARRLSLDALVAGALLRYPRYYSFRIGAFCTAEDMVFELAAARARSPSAPSAWSSGLRRLRGLALSAAEWARAR